MLPSLACDPYSCMAPWLPLTPLTAPLVCVCVYFCFTQHFVGVGAKWQNRE